MTRLAACVSLVLISLLATACGPRETEVVPERILMVVTSHDKVGEDHPTGLWLEEFAVPYELFREAGYEVLVASTLGGKTPVDPASLSEDKQFAATTLAALEQTEKLDTVDLDSCVAVFFPGGHGTMFDMPNNQVVQAAVSHFIAADEPTALVCHGPAALVGATLPDGTPVVKGRRVTGFTNDEERAVKLDDKMPFLLEDRLRELGGEFAGAEDWAVHVVVDGNLITGQNPASSEKAARAVLAQLQTSD